ncbi:MAG: PDZ domain-containing protein [Burkholderiales bacterium]
MTQASSARERLLHERHAELRTRGRVVRGRLGVRTQEVTPQLARAFGLADATGALVLVVERTSPAEKAGIVAGDIIAMVDGKAVRRPSDLLQIAGATAPGTTVRLQVWRRGAPRELVVTISELGVEQARAPSEPEPKRPDRLGLVLSELTPDQRYALGTEDGLFVRGARGTAARAGVQAGDVILAINDVRLQRLEEFDKALATLTPGVTVALLVARGGVVAYVPIELTS